MMFVFKNPLLQNHCTRNAYIQINTVYIVTILNCKNCDPRTKTGAPRRFHSLTQKYVDQCLKIFYSKTIFTQTLVYIVKNLYCKQVTAKQNYCFRRGSKYNISRKTYELQCNRPILRPGIDSKLTQKYIGNILVNFFLKNYSSAVC